MQQVSKVILFLRGGKFAARAQRVKKRYFTNELHTKNYWHP
jgi:hypothetical protein